MPSKNSRLVLRSNAKKFINNYLQENPCNVCGNNDYLTFHHVEPRNGNRRSVGDLVHSGASQQRLLRELSRCQVVCRRCHDDVHGIVYKSKESATRSIENSSWRLLPCGDYVSHETFKRLFEKNA